MLWHLEIPDGDVKTCEHLSFGVRDNIGQHVATIRIVGPHKEAMDKATTIIRIINAHPDLLAACEAGVHLCENIGRGKIRSGRQVGDQLAEWCNEAEAAIAKARGGTE